jgi:probable F420-dependent oxidoreductase
MKFGIHLPQFGRAAGPESISRAARHAEELGFSDVWVSDHIVVPNGVKYPPAHLYEPLITLVWAAAATEQVGVGTSILIAPNRHPVHLAKELATLDQLSKGRVVLGLGTGWLAEEFATLGVPVAERGSRTNECVDVLRACWGDEDPVNFAGTRVTIVDMKVRPKPAHDIPIWIGGLSEGAIRRAETRGDGWHGIGAPEVVQPMAKRLRDERPEESFTLSIRTDWDGLSTSSDIIRQQAEEYLAIGIQHAVAVPAQADLEGWMRSAEQLWRLISPIT